MKDTILVLVSDELDVVEEIQSLQERYDWSKLAVVNSNSLYSLSLNQVDVQGIKYHYQFFNNLNRSLFANLIIDNTEDNINIIKPQLLATIEEQLRHNLHMMSNTIATLQINKNTILEYYMKIKTIRADLIDKIKNCSEANDLAYISVRNTIQSTDVWPQYLSLL